jgi:hypothetical protein
MLDDLRQAAVVFLISGGLSQIIEHGEFPLNSLL